MNRKFFSGLATVLLIAAALPVSVQAQDGVKPAKAKKAQKTTAPGGKVKFTPGSGETSGQRDARLKRECKGAANAGACTGYTR